MIYLNGTTVNPTIFPDNTSQVWKLPNKLLTEAAVFEVDWEFTHEGEFLQLAQLKDLLNLYPAKTYLTIKYLPYARQDKEVTNETTFALRTFTKLLNSLHFDEVAINDPHSKIAIDLINDSHPYYPLDIVEKIAILNDINLFCYPDKGALEKYSKMFYYPYVYCNKIRDQITGSITEHKLIGDVKDKKVLIVDDICDGGLTFMLTSVLLEKAGAKEVNLFVSHGIFSKGLRVLKEAGIKRVFTTDGEVSETHNGFTYRRL